MRRPTPSPRDATAKAAPVLAVLLLLATALVPGQSSAALPWTTLVIDTALARPAKMFEAFDTPSLNLYDFNRDGQLEIVSHNDNNHAYVLDSRTGATLAEIVTTHWGPEPWPVRDINPISIGNLYGDGVPCMVIPNAAAFLSAWCYDAAGSTASNFRFVQRWEQKVDASRFEPNFRAEHPWLYNPDGSLNATFSLGMDGHAYMADADGQGGPREVFVETDGFPGQFAFNADGTYRWSKSWFDGNAGAKVLDIDGDRRKDACFASDAGDIACYDAGSGSLKWAFHAVEHGAFPGSVPVSPLFADLDGDGKSEVFFGARHAVYSATQRYPPSLNDPAYNPNWMNETHAIWFLLDSGGNPRWQVSYDWMNPLQYNHPAAIDVNGDGYLDLVAVDWNTIGHKPGDWQTTNRSPNLFALNGRDGSVLWRTAIGAYWSNMDFVIADADGDGGMDVVVPEPKGGGDDLGVYDLATGRSKGVFPVPWSMSRGPVAGDLYGDGRLEIVVPIKRPITDRPNYRSVDVGFREGALVVISTGQRYNVAFSGNFLQSDDQVEQTQHAIVQPPPVVPPVPPTPVVNETLANQTLANQTLANQTLANQTLANQTLANETLPAEETGNATAPPPPTETVRADVPDAGAAPSDKRTPAPGVAFLLAAAAFAAAARRRRG